MDELLQYLIYSCSFLYKKYGFRFIDSAYSPESFGDALIILSSPDLNIKITRDRGQLFMDFKSNLVKQMEPYAWYSIDLIRWFITGECYLHGEMDENNTKFLQENIDKILNVFSSAKVKDTLIELKKLEKERSKKMFDKK